MSSQKGIFGLVSGIISSAILQPFENLKMALMIPPRNMILTNNVLTNMHIAGRYIANSDGIIGFYRGLIAGALRSGFGCYIYFYILRLNKRPGESSINDFFISSFARIVSTIVTNPLSSIQTILQLRDHKRYSKLTEVASDIYKSEGMKGFFRGGMTSCMKEGTFSGFYYMFYEQLKKQGLNKLNAGFISGMLGTAITHPLQLIRIRVQTLKVRGQALSKHVIWEQMGNLHKNGGWMRGLTPRLIKKPIGNTLTFILFQLLEQNLLTF